MQFVSTYILNCLWLPCFTLVLNGDQVLGLENQVLRGFQLKTYWQPQAVRKVFCYPDTHRWGQIQEGALRAHITAIHQSTAYPVSFFCQGLAEQQGKEIMLYHTLNTFSSFHINAGQGLPKSRGRVFAFNGLACSSIVQALTEIMFNNKETYLRPTLQKNSLPVEVLTNGERWSLHPLLKSAPK